MSRETVMAIPRAPYVALYGSHTGDWRKVVVARLSAAGFGHYDPTDENWKGVDEENGDAKQNLIDKLVARQYEALRGAACVVFHLAAAMRWREAPPAPGVAKPNGTPVAAPAARFELGLLAGLGAPPVFVHIEPDVVGRNFLWAYVQQRPNLVRCQTLDEAGERAIAFMRALAAGTDLSRPPPSGGTPSALPA